MKADGKKEIITKAIEYVKTKKELDEAKKSLRNSSRCDAQESIRYTIHTKKKQLEELVKGIDLVKALEAIASLKEDLDDAHILMV